MKKTTAFVARLMTRRIQTRRWRSPLTFSLVVGMLLMPLPPATSPNSMVAIAQSPCPQPLIPCAIDLKTGLFTGACQNSPLSFVVLPNEGGVNDGWKETVVKVNLGTGCTCANFVVEYEGTPTGWTVNIGDSPTNNGFGGDSSNLTISAAETQVLDQTMSVYSTGLAPGVLDRLLTQDLALTDGAIKFVVKNQFLSLSQPHTVLQTPNSQLLYAIPDLLPTSPDGSNIYAGFNRVVSGPGGRIGTGARRVSITLQ